MHSNFSTINFKIAMSFHCCNIFWQPRNFFSLVSMRANSNWRIFGMAVMPFHAMKLLLVCSTTKVCKSQTFEKPNIITWKDWHEIKISTLPVSICLCWVTNMGNYVKNNNLTLTIINIAQRSTTWVPTQNKHLNTGIFVYFSIFLHFFVICDGKRS